MILTKPKSVNAGPISGTGEGVAHSKRWYVALVRMHHEKKVSERLSKMGIDSFVPVQQQIHQWSDRRKMVDTVLLPMMVFVHADAAFCLEQAMKVNSMEREDVQKKIAHIDDYRAKFYKHHTGRDWYDARNYDLSLNSGVLGFEGTMQEILQYLEVRSQLEAENG